MKYTLVSRYPNSTFVITICSSELEQDPEKRKQLDAALEEAGLRKAAIAAAEDAERARQWRVARGTATAEDLAG